jgi:hypothetical protein
LTANREDNVERRVDVDDHQTNIRGLGRWHVASLGVRPEQHLSILVDYDRSDTAYFKRGFSCHSLPPDNCSALNRCWLLLRQDGPNEATEFSGNGSNSDMPMFALVEVPRAGNPKNHRFFWMAFLEEGTSGEHRAV